MIKASVRHIIYEQYRYKDGTYPVKILLIFNRQNKIFLTDIVASPSQLTASLKIKDPIIMKQVEDREHDMKTKLSKLSQQQLKKMTIDDVAKYLRNDDTEEEEEKMGEGKEVFSLDIIKYGKQFADTKIATSRQNYLSALKALTAFYGKDAIDISEVDSAFLTRFERYLANKYKPRARALSLYIGAIRTIHLRAQQEFNIPERGIYKIMNPFAVYKVPKMPAPKHWDLDRSVIEQMIVDRKSFSGVQQTAVDAFLLSFCLAGMNFVDMYECEAPRDGIIHYYRHKTREKRDDGAEMYIRIPDVIKPLYDLYKDPDEKFAFNFYKNYASWNTMTTCLDRGLKLYKKNKGYSERLSSYSARHTWATLCFRHCKNKSVINDGLVHVDQNQRITEIYIRKSYDHVWEANEAFLATFDWSELL